MKIFDFNIHLPQKTSPDVNEVIEDDLNLDAKGLSTGLDLHSQTIASLSGANILLFNQRLFHQSPDLGFFFEGVKNRFGAFMLTALVDFRMPNITEYLDRADRAGVHAFMFNSYLQKITEEDFSAVLEVCKYGEAKRKIICIDGSYGTSKMYTYDNLKLACYVADHIAKSPIVIIHSGGYRIIEAMLLAMDKCNVMLDTSFSLNYYLGSSLEKDYAFAYKRLGAERVLFGSDIPYVNFDEAYHQQLDFFMRNGFSSTALDHIFFKNASRLADGDW